MGLFVTTMIFFGQFLSVALPDEAACTGSSNTLIKATFKMSNVLMSVGGGLFAMVNSMFCGYVIKAQNFPSFWKFAYWLSPLHYALEGITVTQFHGDSTIIVTSTGQKTTAEEFIAAFYSDWSYKHRGYDAMALFIFIIGLR